MISITLHKGEKRSLKIFIFMIICEYKSEIWHNILRYLDIKLPLEFLVQFRENKNFVEMWVYFLSSILKIFDIMHDLWVYIRMKIIGWKMGEEQLNFRFARDECSNKFSCNFRFQYELCQISLIHQNKTTH